MELKEPRREWLVSIGQWLAFFVTAVGAFISALYFREAVLGLLGWVGASRLKSYSEQGIIAQDLRTTAQLAAVDFFVIFLLAILVVIAIVAIEYYYRRGRPKGLLWKRVLKVAGIEAVVIAGSVLLLILIAS